jgi:hypothetical protein
MRLDLKQFSIGMFILLITVMYTLFSIRYFQQREAAATVIYENIRNDLSELAYVLSRHVKKEPVFTSRSLLDRKAANSNAISAIAIFDDQKLLVTTDLKYSEVLNATHMRTNVKDDIYKNLMRNKGIEASIYYYQGKQLKEYNLCLYSPWCIDPLCSDHSKGHHTSA